MPLDHRDISLEEYKPPFLMRPPMVQTFLASQKFRRKKASYINELSEVIILDCGEGVRLKGSLTRHDQEKGIAVLLHGWEGSQDSTYVMSCSHYLYEQGYSIFRLNFRDHGDTHHLNEGIFNSQLFDEVFEGVMQGAGLAPDLPAYLVGFSLGGNFALRVARRQKKRAIPNLSHIFAISPVTDPWDASPRVDENPLIKRYFYKKWSTSLAKKQAAFPGLYDFSNMRSAESVMDLTDLFLSQYTDFKSKQEYFSGYGIEQDDLADCPVNVSMIMAEDDPVIPAGHITTLNLSPCVRRIMLKYGGHNGFYKSLNGPTWYDGYIKCVLKAENS